MNREKKSSCKSTCLNNVVKCQLFNCVPFSPFNCWVYIGCPAPYPYTPKHKPSSLQRNLHSLRGLLLPHFQGVYEGGDSYLKPLKIFLPQRPSINGLSGNWCNGASSTPAVSMVILRSQNGIRQGAIFNSSPGLCLQRGRTSWGQALYRLPWQLSHASR